MLATRRQQPAEGPDPDVRYRTGLAESHRGERRALETLSTALEGYLAKHDIRGAALASAALAVTGQVASNFRRFDEHIARLAERAARCLIPLASTATSELIARFHGPARGDSTISAPQDDAFSVGASTGSWLCSRLDPRRQPEIRRSAAWVLFYIEPRSLRALGRRRLRACCARAWRRARPDAASARRRWRRHVGGLPALPRRRHGHGAACAQPRMRALGERHDLRDASCFWMAYCRRRLAGLAGRAASRSAERGLSRRRGAGWIPRQLRPNSRQAASCSRPGLRRRTQGAGRTARCSTRRAHRRVRASWAPPRSFQAVDCVVGAQARLMIDDFATACELMRTGGRDGAGPVRRRNTRHDLRSPRPTQP